MKSTVKIISGLIGLYLVLMVGSGLAIRALLSTSLGERVRERAQRALPVEVELSGGEFDLVQWMLFRPALALEDLRVGNPDGFSDGPLLQAERVYARAGLFDLLQGQARASAIEINAPLLHIETDAAGRTNIDALLDAVDQAESAPAETSDSPAELSIDSFLITSGRIVYSAPGEPDFIVKNVDVAAENINLREAFDFSAQLDLFEEEAVAIGFTGVAGPFSERSLPARGALTVDASPGRMPAEFRYKTLGAFLEDPGSSSEAAIAVDLDGDLLGTISGEGTIDFVDIRLGHEGASQLPLSGQARVLLTLLNPLANPAFQAILPDASLAFGQGNWRGEVEANYDGQVVSGRSAGAIEGVDVNEMMTAFTDSPDVAFGSLKMPRYEIRFSGRDSNEIFNSLAGDGRFDLADGRFAVFDTLQTIEGHAQKLLTGVSAAQGSTNFVGFGSDLTVRGQRVHLSDIALASDTLRMTGAGSFGFDQSLDIDLDSAVTGSLAELLGGQRDEQGVAWVGVPLHVRGSVASPSVTPDLGRLVKGEAIRRATGLLESLLRGKEDETPEGEASENETPEGETPQEEQPRQLPFGLGDLLKPKAETEPEQPQ